MRINETIASSQCPPPQDDVIIISSTILPGPASCTPQCTERTSFSGVDYIVRSRCESENTAYNDPFQSQAGIASRALFAGDTCGNTNIKSLTLTPTDSCLPTTSASFPTSRTTCDGTSFTTTLYSLQGCTGRSSPGITNTINTCETYSLSQGVDESFFNQCIPPASSGSSLTPSILWMVISVALGLLSGL